MRQFVVVAALLVVGCNARPDVACDIVNKSSPTPTHRCSELDNLDPKQKKDAENACPLQDGVLVSACPTEGLIGLCTLVFDGATRTIYSYSDGGVTAADSEASCKQLAGTWSDGLFPDPG